ncbi:hypothetical protein AGABI1DRAFT_132421 [Agaricus bisporus var. burnettii JB137-S8]|uniref:G-protein coupled receptors family 1 profile domain-containing protein n=1 Tax=Agaricus bisporus var. burnettii (strain JB137-S8 / ATCC MYA-4627 / FGSC 10392) TaxID=597362 RepID=K5VLK6_AGABU|nr:uncharacterized protein AGABI1DRAFT_132421 [Agaricus bisporus var. burnettii JB137-S8]EKM75284.1 hypothetical protein AGABI1DRAFT_132421 [Agaricus bisporus var. burnettii JB137-S8]
MIACATIDIITLNLYTKTVYLDIRALPIGPDRTLAKKRAFAIGKANIVVTFVETTLSLGVLSWRVWTIWSGTRLVIPVAIFSLLLYLAATGTYISYIIITWSIPYSSSSTPSLFEQVLSASVALIAASMVFMTLMIVSRLMVVRRKHIKIMGKTESAAQYLGITAMLVESFALAVVWILALLICPLFESAIPAYNFFNASAVQIQVLTYFLIIYRVFSGRAWNGQTQSRLSTLQWGQDATQPADTTIRTISIGIVNERDDSPAGNIHV